MNIINRVFCTCILTLLATSAHALDDLTFDVAPGTNIAGGMGLVKGVAGLTITTEAAAPTWYIVNISPKVDPTVLWKEPSKFQPCLPQCFKNWLYVAAPSKRNAVMLAMFPGTLAPCTSGGQGELPTFEGLVAHVDFDVDSDNNNPAYRRNQRTPNRSDREDAVEDIGDPLLENRTGLIICQNSRYAESGQGKEPVREQDYQVAGVVVGDFDLAKAQYQVDGRDGTSTFTYGSAIRLYTADGKSVESGEAIPTPQGKYTYLIEGITPGRTTITATFKPTGGIHQCTDEVAVTVMPVFKIKQSAFIQWDYVPSPPANLLTAFLNWTPDNALRPFFYVQGGDNRGLSADSDKYRGISVAIVIPLELCSPNRIGQRGFFRDVGITREYSFEALADDGVLDPESDAEYLTRTRKASIEQIQSEVSRINPREVEIRLTGALTNPLTRPQTLVPSINWSYVIRVRDDGKYRVTGTHNGYPGHEIYINRHLVHGFVPEGRPEGFWDVYAQIWQIMWGLGATVLPVDEDGVIP